MKKGTFAMLLALLLFLCSCASDLPSDSAETTPAAPDVTQSIEYEFLSGIGIPASYLDGLHRYDLIRLYTYVHDRTCQFYALDTAENEDLTLSLLVLRDWDKDEVAEWTYGMCLFVTYQWAEGKPTLRGEDSIVINWDNSVLNGPAYDIAICNEARSESGEWVVYESYENMARANQRMAEYFASSKYAPSSATVLKGSGFFSMSPKYIYVTVEELGEMPVCVRYIHGDTVLGVGDLNLATPLQ